MEPTLRLPTCADHLHRLLTIGEQVLDACELRLTDVPAGMCPFDRVAELRDVAVETHDLPMIRRLNAALEFTPIADAASRAQALDELATLVERAESCLATVLGGHLEVVRG